MPRLLLTAFTLTLSLPATALCCEGDAGKKAAVQPAGDEAAARPIVRRHLAALGGEAALRAAGTFTFTMKDLASEDRSVVYQARPNLMRKEIRKGGALLVKAFDGQRGWRAEGAAAPVLMTEKDSAMMASYAEFDDALVDYERRGHRVALLGAAEVGGARTYHLRVTLKGGDSEERFLDKGSLMEVQRVVRFSKDGKEHRKIIRFSDYRKVDGLLVNHALEVDHDGAVTRYAVTDLSYRRPLSASLFQAPQNATLAQAR